jgi:hypothetical protein
MKCILFDVDKMDVVVNKWSEIQFKFDPEQQNNATTEIADNSIAKNVMISVNERFAFQKDCVEKVMVRQQEMQKMERCIITNNTGSIRVTVWEDYIKTVKNNVCYSLTNVGMKEYSTTKL